MPSSDDPLSVFQLLARAGVPYVIIGGHAVIFHGYVRTTEDADLIFERSGASEAALLEVLQSIYACWISDQRDPATGHERLVPVSPSYVRGRHLMMLTTDLGFLDLYSAGSGRGGGHFRGGRGPGQRLRDEARDATRPGWPGTRMSREVGSHGGARLRVRQRSSAAS
jgi:hypothetical protein